MAKAAALIATLLLYTPFSAAQLNTLAQAAGKKYFGTATDNPELTDIPYVAQLENTADFHQLTPVSSNSTVSGHIMNIFIYRPIA